MIKIVAQLKQPFSTGLSFLSSLEKIHWLLLFDRFLLVLFLSWTWLVPSGVQQGFSTAVLLLLGFYLYSALLCGICYLFCSPYGIVSNGTNTGKILFTFLLAESFMLYVVLTFESVDEILWCDHSNETSSAVLLHGTICFAKSYNIWVGKVSVAVYNGAV